MYKISKELPYADKIEIVPAGDLHHGSRNCRLDKFKRLVDWITPRKSTYVILMGDLLDCILPKDKRFDADDKYAYKTIDTLRDELVTILTPIKERILVMLMGNHEHHLHQDGYGDPIKYMCKELDVPYGGYSCYLKLTARPKTHKRPLLLWLHHGWFAGRKRGAKVNNLEDNLAYYDADVYLVGHSHDLWATRKSRIYWGGSRDVIFGNTGSFLETATNNTTSYAERANFPPQKLGVLKLIWQPKDGKCYVSE